MTGFGLILEGKNERKNGEWGMGDGDGRGLRGGGAWRGKAKVIFFFKKGKSTEVSIMR